MERILLTTNETYLWLSMMQILRKG